MRETTVAFYVAVICTSIYIASDKHIMAFFFGVLAVILWAVDIYKEWKK
jgi:hypothetical protein